MHDKLQALQQLSRTLGLFEADNVQRRGQGDALTRLMEEIQKARSRAPIAYDVDIDDAE